ncbi:MAG TPA: hypothetical protein VEA39_07580 [Methylophilaceae bacterium]|nr:hypothetical protein [Methylophilaceae bacterium]
MSQDKEALFQACATLAKVTELLGIPEEEVTGEPDEIYEAIETLQSQRDELLASMRRLSNLNAYEDYELRELVREIATEAIAKVEQS